MTWWRASVRSLGVRRGRRCLLRGRVCVNQRPTASGTGKDTIETQVAVIFRTGKHAHTLIHSQAHM